jgi:hypothetical protein
MRPLIAYFEMIYQKFDEKLAPHKLTEDYNMLASNIKEVHNIYQ